MKDETGLTSVHIRNYYQGYMYAPTIEGHLDLNHITHDYSHLLLLKMVYNVCELR